MRQKALVLSLLALTAGGISCDRATRPLTTGSIAIHLVTPDGQAAVIGAVAPGLSADAAPMETGGGLASVTLTGVRVTVSGPTSKSVTNTTPTNGNFEITITDLDAGSYTVTVEGLVNNQVSNFGQTSSVTVTSGATTPASVTFQSFRPAIPASTVVDTADVLHFTVSWGAVTGATSYIVAWSLNADMSGAQSKTVTTTTTDVQVTAEGKYYVTVQAVNNVVTSGGLPSPAKGVYVFQGVATVAVTPGTPSIAYGATQQFTAEARDADNNVVSNVVWFWASSNHTVATVNQSGLVTSVGSGTATITAVGKGTPGNAALTVNPPPGSKLVFTTQPVSATAGSSIANVQVAVQNTLGQTATSDNATQVTVAIGANPGSGTLGGTKTVTVTAGIANFGTLSIDKTGTGYTLSASATNLAGSNSAPFNVTPGAAASLAFSVQPTTVKAGSAISPAVQVEVRDANDNLVTSNRDAITISIGNNPGSGTLAGTKVVNAVGGIATFSGLSIDNAGTAYTLTASDASMNAASSGFDVTAPPPAAKLAFTVQPSDAIAGDALSPAIQVEIQDANGARITTARDQVTVTFSNNAGSGSLAGTKTVNAINGVASFTGLWINKSANGYTLSAASGSLTGATSSAFNISPAAPAKLAFTGQPSNVQGNTAITPSVTVSIRDQFDNVVNTATNQITMNLGDNPWKTPFATGGTLSGTLQVSAVAGVASFSTLRIDKPAPAYTLSATSGSLSGGISSAFNVNLTFSQVSSGGNHTCGIATGATYCWGLNNSGQLAATTGSVARDSIAALVKGGLTFVAIASGGAHTCGITSSNDAYCWGNNGSGQLGNGTNTSTGPTGSPVAVSGGHKFAKIDAGNSHTCGITTASGVAAEDRQVYCWGYNYYGQLGNAATIPGGADSNVPVRVDAASALQSTTRAASLALGVYHSCAVALNGTAYCWGNDDNGQLGDDATLASKSSPVAVSGGATFTAIAAGDYHTCGIISVPPDSPARCWGYNYYGQLGDNTTLTNGGGGTNQPTPVAVFANLNYSAITTGSYHTCAITSGGVGYCWGLNNVGQLGDDLLGTNTSQRSAVAGGLTLTSINAGSSHTCAQTASAVYCWGSNSSGQGGTAGVGVNKRTPQQIVQ